MTALLDLEELLEDIVGSYPDGSACVRTWLDGDLEELGRLVNLALIEKQQQEALTHEC
jgi:hypothetical protein